MNRDVKVRPAPKVYCPKDGEQIPIWYCVGSLTVGSLSQDRDICPYLVKAVIHGAEAAEVECIWRENDEL